QESARINAFYVCHIPPSIPGPGPLNGLRCKDRYFLDNQTKICQGMKYKFYTSGLTYDESE
ncbi:MAG: hypothetical protein K2H50_08420, partial [Paramuribaculum sp.]|nr:hypothetical protein [Paramuribaculum sp.]